MEEEVEEEFIEVMRFIQQADYDSPATLAEIVRIMEEVPEARYFVYEKANRFGDHIVTPFLELFERNQDKDLRFYLALTLFHYDHDKFFDILQKAIREGGQDEVSLTVRCLLPEETPLFSRDMLYRLSSYNEHEMRQTSQITPEKMIARSLLEATRKGGIELPQHIIDFYGAPGMPKDILYSLRGKLK